MQKQWKIWKSMAYVALATMVAVSLTACGSSSSTPVVPVVPIAPTVQVTDTAGVAVEGAMVYAIPAADVAAIAAQPITLQASGDYDAAAMNVDEPLEDLVNGNFTPTGSGVATYITATTDATGKAVLTGLPVAATDMFFIYVAPAATDAGRLPGGSLCRNAVTGASLDNKVTGVEVSTAPSATASYIGSSACLVCHNGTLPGLSDKSGVKMTAHKHGIMNIGSPSGLQNLAKFDDGTSDGVDDGIYNYMAGVSMFTAGDLTSGGTTVYFYNFDGTRGFDKFQTSVIDPRLAAPSTVVDASVRAYKDMTSGKYMMQIINVATPSDTNSPLNLEAVMTYGGGVYKQRYLTVSASGATMHMLPLQFQPAGDDASTDRTRQQYRDYHMDRWYDGSTKTIKAAGPAAGTAFDINCASCHYNGYQVTKDATTGEFTATAVADANGTMNPLTGTKQEMNVGCETCHGPGSEHQAAGGLGMAIVNPNDLSVERVTMLCGRCHSRPQGNSSVAFGVNTDQPLDVNNEMLHPGASRADYLANNTFRDDAKASDMWADGLHSKSHHQQYTDFIQTAKYRNGSALKTCVDCHEIHAPGTDRHQLNGTSDNSLCASCHAVQGADLVAHMVAKTGVSMNLGNTTAQCIQCHFAKNAKSGAGDPMGKPGVSGKIYRQNDISSHLLTVATKADAVAQQMPVPYTNTCGVCHGTTLGAPL